MPEFIFEGVANWKSGTECDLTVKGKHIATVSPPPEFGEKRGIVSQKKFSQRPSLRALTRCFF
jgi:hypothetical protein